MKRCFSLHMAALNGDSLKEQANEYFKAGKYRESIDLYTQAIGCLISPRN